MEKLKQDTKPKCEKCKKALVAIADKRQNGKIGNDWDTRKYHKKCYKELIAEMELREYIRRKYNLVV
jgi:hypothetical protein